MAQEKKLKFNEAMKRLDEIVTLLNNEDLELEKAMELFVEGTTLSAQCEKQLKDFENQMQVIMNPQEKTDD